MKAPFPYFGGKSKIAHLVWEALGQPRHYIEPFFGSGAILLARPGYDPARHIETVNDKDGFVANVWRSLKFSPKETAQWCDWPVNHADLCARRKEMIKNEGRLLDNLKKHPEWHDPVIAGYWIWAASCWIGGGLTSAGEGFGKRPRLTGFTETGVHSIGRIPHLMGGGGPGRGVHRMTSVIYTTFQAYSERLRRVRVCCGDWTVVCGGNWQDNLGTVGIFFDPPYGVKDRDDSIYHHDSMDVAALVNAWALERGKKDSYRIVITGYEEHENLLSEGWTAHSWKANGGYGNRAGNKNCEREMIYFSPHCLVNQMEMGL